LRQATARALDRRVSTIGATAPSLLINTVCSAVEWQHDQRASFLTHSSLARKLGLWFRVPRLQLPAKSAAPQTTHQAPPGCDLDAFLCMGRRSKRPCDAQQWIDHLKKATTGMQFECWLINKTTSIMPMLEPSDASESDNMRSGGHERKMVLHLLQFLGFASVTPCYRRF
jgi:hypothetical protein